MAIKADQVWLAGKDADTLIPMSQLQVDDCIRVRTGSVIPVDGQITEGEAYINEASMTGEPLAVMKSAGSSVFAGTVVEEGSVVIKVRKLSSDTKISKIIELIDNSENLKAGVQSNAERLADSIVPVPYSFLGFALTLLLTRNVTKAVSVLMVDYSCAIKLSTPIAVISAIKETADSDVTVKGGKYLEEYALADSIVFDKTGTLTNAEPMLEKVIALCNYSEEDTLKIAACLEEHFPHSVARAIVKGAADRNIDHAEEHAEVQYIVAHGISTILHGKRAIIGSRHFVCEDEGIEITEEQQAEIDEKSGACSVVYLAVGDKLTGALCISDPPRPEAEQAVKQLKEAGITNIVMLTGDSTKVAEITAQKLGISDFRAQVLPEDKHRNVE
ncbi:HAD-IC family P-type ATPase [uncultured Ruminococcus sp.]|uniref:HAD-IC family P-type ATPase n=1 Tax=uncultured Ruminococcus sp. TaxID=165186 RepID=UPI00345BB530